MKDLSLKIIAREMEGELFCSKADEDKTIEGAVIDSRKVLKDYLFFATKGQRADGHDFVDKVFEMGALAVVSERKLDTDKPYILVKSSLEALKKLAEYYRSILNIPIIGITGSVGKTSTKEFIASVLSTKYNVLKTEGNYNNEIGLPLTILSIKAQHEAAVVEMGISDFGEMTRLSKIARPDICVITNIGICHLENLKDRNGVLKAKTEMFKYAKNDCEIVLNGDDDKLISVKEYKGKKVHYFGMSSDFEIYAENVVSNGIMGTDCTICTDKDKTDVHINIPGVHMVSNSMAAAMVGKLLGLRPAEIKAGIESLSSAAGRVNIIERDYIVIDDCYNANPVSMKASIDLLNTAKGRKIAILGDMFELGKNEKELHYEMGKYLAKTHTDYIFLSGNLSENIFSGYTDEKQSSDNIKWFENMEDLIYNLKQFVKKNDTILVKASHSMHYENIVKALS